MRHIDQITKKINIDDYVKRAAADTDFKELVKEPTVIVRDGQERVIYDFVDFETAKYAEALKKIRYIDDIRTSGLKTQSRTFGYAPRNTLRKDFCASASMAEEHPAEHALLVELGQKLANVYLKNAPGVYGKHKEIAGYKVQKQWQIPGTPFTSGIVNKNNQLAYHFDTGNFKKVFSCMIAFKSPGCKGGHLSLPEYDIGLEIANNSVLLFDGQEILHGVTPFETEEDGYRFTVVYYSLQRMWQCLTVTEEIARIRKVKTAREQKRAQPKQ